MFQNVLVEQLGSHGLFRCCLINKCWIESIDVQFSTTIISESLTVAYLVSPGKGFLKICKTILSAMCFRLNVATVFPRLCGEGLGRTQGGTYMIAP